MSGSIPTLSQRPADPIGAAIRGLERQAGAVAQARVRVGDSISLTAQVATIASTKLITAATNGIYRICAVLQCTTADAAAGTLTLTIGWTDRVAATTTTLTLALTATGRNEGDHTMQVQGNTDITYAVTIAGGFGAAVYALELKLERISS